MKVLVFSPYALWCPSYEYELEIMQNHLDAGDDVAVAVCNGALPSCDVNPSHDPSCCCQCVGRRLFGLTQLSKPVRQIPILSPQGLDWEGSWSLPHRFTSLEALQNLRVDNFDLGSGVLSSLVGVVREALPDLSDPFVGRLAFRLALSALQVYRTLGATLDREGFDRVYVLQGHLSILRAVLRACQFEGVDCLVHDQGRDVHHYSLHRNTTMLDLFYLEKLIVDTWQTAESEEREKVAWDYFLGRDERGTSNLPDGWDPQLNNIVLIASVEDDLAPLGKGWMSSVYRDQREGVRSIAAICSQMPGTRLYIQIDPEQKGQESSRPFMEGLSTLNTPKVTVLPFGSPVNSITLLKNASRTVTFGSTLSLDSTFWEVPSILLGQAPYRNLGSTYNPAHEQELFQLLDKPLPPKAKQGALQYAYFKSTLGQRARYFDSAGAGMYRSIPLRETGFFATMTDYLENNPRLRRALRAVSGAISLTRLSGRPY